MKRSYHLIPLPFLMICSCNDQVCDPNTVTTTLLEKREIQMSFDTSRQEIVYSILEGDKLVFQYEYHKGHCDGYTHDSYTLSLAFELPSGETDFVLSDSALVEADCFVHHSNGWIDNDYPVSSGTMKGEKLAEDRWFIRGAIKYMVPLSSFNQDRELSFDEVFIR